MSSAPVAIANDGSEVIAATLPDPKYERPPECSVEDYYETDRTIASVIHLNSKRVALQFPDDLLGDATAVVNVLRRNAPEGVQFFTLADTTYGSCCVDEIAAEHANCDLVIHYGRSCQSPVTRIPAILVFGKQLVDLEDCAAQFNSAFQDNQDRAIIVLADVIYYHFFSALKGVLGNRYPNLIFSATYSNELHPGSTKPTAGPTYTLPPGSSPTDSAVFYIGGESLALSNVILTHSLFSQIVSYDPETKQSRVESSTINRILMKRFLNIQHAKNSKVIGIVVGTLGVGSYLSIIEHLKSLIKKSGRKPYVLAVGKPNPAKLANFLEIDVFVLVACPENSLLDTKEFLKPIVTPFELTLALGGKDSEWTPGVGDYVTEFGTLMSRLEALVVDSKPGDTDSEQQNPTMEADSKVERASSWQDQESDDEPEFSLVTGKLITTKRYQDNDGKSVPTEVGESGLVALRNGEQALSKFSAMSAAAEFLNTKRTYRGLEPSIGESAPAEIEEGRSGVARGYRDEKDLR
ncbi:putative diphthamide synthesis protein-domain-containing protein [Cladochytrium replicatum]|nr:putative diphthamide synthesis protein-domain-containing protein [Cladochytrium replicatum]